MTDKDKKQEILDDIKKGTYVDREDVRRETAHEKARRDANGGWST